MATIVSKTHPIAKKAYFCSVCGGVIKSGERYVRVAYANHKKVTSERLHFSHRKTKEQLIKMMEAK